MTRKALDMIFEAQASQVKRLSFRGMSIDEVPGEIGTLSDLTLLDLRGNRLKDLPPEISGLPNLTTLELSYNNFRTIPSVVFTLRSLRKLILSVTLPLLGPLITRDFRVLG